MTVIPQNLFFSAAAPTADQIRLISSQTIHQNDITKVKYFSRETFQFVSAQTWSSICFSQKSNRGKFIAFLSVLVLRTATNVQAGSSLRCAPAILNANRWILGPWSKLGAGTAVL